jgi:hypothetical protein
MPKPSPQEDQASAAQDDTGPMMPEDSVLRRIDDDIQLMERRADRAFFLGDTINDILTVREVLHEREEDRRAKAEGRVRLRRQITAPMGFLTYWRGLREPWWYYALMILAVLVGAGLLVAFELAT